MRQRYPKHLLAFSYLGAYRYHLTLCADARRPVFRSATTVDLAREQVLRAAKQLKFAVVVYCFMPDHVHLLVEGLTAGSDCRRFLTLAKQYSGFSHRVRFKERLWQRFSHERVLRETEQTHVVVRYILENPIRAGLVTRVEDYPFIGSSVYSLPDLLEFVGLERA